MSWLAAVTVSALLSMPGLGGGDEEGIEVPAANEIWQATVTDNTLTETPLQEFSWDGYAHMQGKLGAGEIAIKFVDIKSIDFEPTEKNRALALVVLKSGVIKKISVDGRANLYGKTGFGNYKLLVKDTKRIVFSGSPVPRPSTTPKPAITSTSGAPATNASKATIAPSGLDGAPPRTPVTPSGLDGAPPRTPGTTP